MIQKLADHPLITSFAAVAVSGGVAVLEYISSIPNYVWQLPIVGAFIYFALCLLNFTKGIMDDNRSQNDKRDKQWLAALGERDDLITRMHAESLSSEKETRDVLLKVILAMNDNQHTAEDLARTAKDLNISVESLKTLIACKIEPTQENDNG